MRIFSSRHFLVASLVAAFAAPAARAQTNFIWANTGSDWNVPASWTNLAVPTATDFANFTTLGPGVINPDLGTTSQTIASLVLDTSPAGGGYTLTSSGGGTLTVTNPNTAATQVVPGSITVRGGVHTFSNVAVTVTNAPFNMALEVASSGTLVLGNGASLTTTNAANFTELRGYGSALVFDATGTGPTPTL